MGLVCYLAGFNMKKVQYKDVLLQCGTWGPGEAEIPVEALIHHNYTETLF